MKISLNWIKQFTDIKLSADELVAKIGSQLGEVEEVIHVGEQYKDVVIAKVVACEKHPNADKLKVCLLDDGGTTPDVNRGEGGLIQLVCGAPNVKEGMLIAWLPPGSIVPETYFSAEQFVLEARELRGVVSNGMIASARELALGDEHDGILEIDVEAQPGDSFAKLYELENEIVIDIENKMFTHRPDCFGVLGVAREIAGIQHIQFKSPEWYLEGVKSEGLKVKKEGLALTVDSQLPDLVPRFMAVAMDNIVVKPSPVKIRSYLARVGLKPINNIVDTTNIVMHLTGQPLHAFDYDKVAKVCGGDPVIEVRHPQENETVALLNGKTISPRPEAIMIATPQQLIGVAGAMGGSETEVDETTTRIILECATFDMYSIRRTSMEHGLFTDAVTRFTKGQSPHQNDKVLAIAIQDIMDFADGKIASEIIDVAHNLPTNQSIEVSTKFINQRLGSKLDNSTITDLLRNVEFEVTSAEDTLQVTAPYWRTDIAIAEDIVEEVGRLYGYDNLSKTLPTRTIKPAQRSALLAFKQRLREILAQTGANEVLTYSFVSQDLLEAAGQNADDAYSLSNALSPDLQKYRLSLTPSLLSHVHANIKTGHGDFVLFEVGKTHNKNHLNDEHVPMEIESLAGVYARNHQNDTGAAFYSVRRILDYLAGQLGLELQYDVIETDLDYQITAPFESNRSATISIKGSEKVIGIIGEYEQSVIKKLKLPEWAAGFEISIQNLMAAADTVPVYAPLSAYPAVSLDVTLKVDEAVLFKELYEQLLEGADKIDTSKYSVTILPLQVYQAEGGDTKNLTFQITITSSYQTLTSEAANRVMDSLLKDVNIDFSVV